MANYNSSGFNPFQSQNLIYRCPETNEQDAKFWDMIQKDPMYLRNCSGDVLRPGNRETSDEDLKDFRKCVLGVFICLPAPPPPCKEENADNLYPSKKSAGAAEKHSENLPVPVGYIKLSGGSTEPSSYSHHQRVLWLALAVAPAYRGRGIGREALMWALDWSFRHAGMHSVGLACFEYNTPARRLYESVGFIQGGVYRKEHWFDGRWWDMCLYAILEDEWAALRRKEQESRKVEGGEDVSLRPKSEDRV